MATINGERLKRLFLELVGIDSLSRREREVARRLRRELESAGATCHYDNTAEKVHGNSGNLIGRMKANGASTAALLLSAHMDTVVPGERVKPVVEGDIIHSDGTTILGGDDKSGCAIICEVLHRLHEDNLPHGPIDVVFTVCEEIGLLGARHLDLSLIEAREGLVYDSDRPDYLIVRAPAAVGMRFTVKGLEAHAGIAPERGLSAIRIAAEAIASMRLGRIDGDTTANLGTVQGGRAVNIVPDEVSVRGEARSLDPVKLKAQTDHMIGCFKAAAARASVTIDGRVIRPSLEYVVRPTYDGMTVSETAPLVRDVLEAARRAGRILQPQATGGGCDANIFNKRGLSVANIGTGMRDIHTVRESIDVKDMIATAEVTLELIKLRAQAAA